MNCTSCGSQNTDDAKFCAGCGKSTVGTVNSTALKQNIELRAVARGILKGKWLNPVLVTLIYMAIASTLQFIPVLGSIAFLIIGGPLIIGVTMYFLALSRLQDPKIEMMFDGFKIFSKSLGVYLLTTLFTLLWMLLLIVPGIVAAFRYAMSYYILIDNPQLTAMDAIEQSKKMMHGNKGKLFMLGLSFIGWGILACLTLGIGFLWLIPYMQVATAKFYEDLKTNAPASGLTRPSP